MSGRFDVVVVGAGPAGIAAAVTAGTSGRTVALVDDNPAPGGQIWRASIQGPGAHTSRAAQQWLRKLTASDVTLYAGTRVFDLPSAGVLRAERGDACVELGYGKLILATGARELFLPFPGWTLPNVTGAGGLDAMTRGGLPVAKKRVVVAGTGPLLLAVAAHLAAQGAKMAAICEQASLGRLARFAGRMMSQPGKLAQGVGYRWAARGARFHTGCWPVSAEGDSKLESVTLWKGDRTWQVACDYLACGFHLVPNVELARLAGCRIEDGFVTVDDLMQTSAAQVLCAGEPTGIGGMDLALLEGQIAGLVAAERMDAARPLVRRRGRMLGFVRALREATALNPQLRSLATDATLVCRCEDVAYGALREHTSWRAAKLNTRCGMGPCQGRVCGAATEFLLGWSVDDLRPPAFPALVSSLMNQKETQ